MTLTIVVMDKNEDFLQFLDPDLCTIEEEIEYGGLRTLSLDYKFQDRVEDKELFKIGNKIWIQGDPNLTDCLYVINTEVKQDIFKENNFELELEEVLVELNYSIPFSQSELTNRVDNTTGEIMSEVEAKAKYPSNWETKTHRVPTWNLKSTNGKQEVVVDWNSLNYWFGEYFNIGVVQECISEYASRISVTGTVNRMDLLRNIEEETGNVFVTRYEKDCLDNTIHRYLDFLNPINCNKNWIWNMEYDFKDINNVAVCYDANGNVVKDDKDWEVIRFENSKYDEEAIDEDTDTSDEDDYDSEAGDEYDPENAEEYDFEKWREFIPDSNINPSNCVLRIVDEDENVYDADGNKWSEGDTADPLQWRCVDIGMVDTNYPSYLISIQKLRDVIGVSVNTKSFVVAGIGGKTTAYLPEFNSLEYEEYIASDAELSYQKFPDNCYFEIYDQVNSQVLYRTKLDTQIGTVHEEILDFGVNLENISFNIDETSTYSAVAPVLNPNNNSSAGKELSRSDIDTIINRWKNLSISKGDIIPMIVEKFNIEGTSYSNAVSKLGTYGLSNNYRIRPLKPTDNTDNDPKQYEFYRAVAYWKAPYDKPSGELYVETNKTSIEYDSINVRPDTREERTKIANPKIGNTESSDEDIYAIYNQVALYLKEHEEPKIDIEVDVANVQGNTYNNYQLHDKVYLKLANTRELLTARVTKTHKEAHDIAKNTVELSNYRAPNTIKTVPQPTYIEAPNADFVYPASKNLTMQLINGDYDPESETSIHYPVGKLITFTLYKKENGQSTNTGKSYTKLTDAYGRATINLKYDPGDYEMDIHFYGDEEFDESSLTIRIHVGGTLPKPVTQSNKTSTKTKTTKKNKTKTKTKVVKSYWTKCGLSPDKKHKKIVAIARPSSADAYKYKYQQLWKTVFKNYCPNCKRWGGLRFDGGKINRCITSSTYGHPWKDDVQYEHEITCIYCDSDYCGVTGQEKSYGHISRLKTVEKPKKSSQTDYNKLVKGKLLYDKKTVKVKVKKVESSKTRKIRAKGISKKVKQQALKIVGDKVGSTAMKEIVKFMDNKISYHFHSGFDWSASTCLSKKAANCCDGTRLFFELCDAAGLCEYYNFYYVHVQCPKWGHVYAIVETKKTKKWRYVDVSSDSHGCWGYVVQSCPHGRRSSKYPKLPF